MTTAKLIAAVEALPRDFRTHRKAWEPVDTVDLADVLRLIHEHDPTAAIVAWLERERDRWVECRQRAEYNVGQDLIWRLCDDRAAQCQRLADDLKSGKAGL